MRSSYLATLLTMVLLICSGCRQTTLPTASSPLTPASSAGTLSPLGPGQTPVLGPFGGPTRVTPPATGSHTAPNSYTGGVVPIGRANPSVISPTDQVIGSGVQVAGWAETQSPLAQTGPGVQGNPPANVSAPNPRSGGMQIIDLTGAPPPPGYRPSFPPAAVPAYPNVQNPGVQYPGVQNPGVQYPGVQYPGVQNPGVGSGLRTINVPSAGQIARAPTQAFPSTAPSQAAAAPVQTPSTEPINSSGGAGGQQNLPWRRPGTRF